MVEYLSPVPCLGWALCFIAAAFPALFIAVAGRYLKESPKDLELQL
jgi:hypothetical protein